MQIVLLQYADQRSADIVAPMSALSREQFIEEILRIVPDRFPLVKLARGEQAFSMRINGQVVPLEDLYRAMAALNPREMRRQIDRWVVELLRIAEGTPDRGGSFKELRERILPMVLSEASAQTEHRQTLSQPVVPGLRVAYAIDSDRSITYISKAQVEAWGVDADQLHDAAITNLVARSEAMQAQVAEDESGQTNFILFQASDGYDASRLLLPTLHDRLREHLGSPFAAAIPNRDILICFRDVPENTGQVQSQVKEDFRKMPHQVTDMLFLVTADGIAPWA